MKSNGRYTYLKPDGSGFSEVYSPDNKPTKSDVGLRNVANERQYSENNKIPNQDYLMYVKFAKNANGHLAYIGVNDKDAYLISSTLTVAQVVVAYSVTGWSGYKYGSWVNIVSFSRCDIPDAYIDRFVTRSIHNQNTTHSAVIEFRIISGESNTKILQARGGALTAAGSTFSGEWRVSISVRELSKQWNSV